jgi:hypothetical protein
MYGLDNIKLANTGLKDLNDEAYIARDYICLSKREKKFKNGY